VPQFFRATVKGLKSDEELETILTLRIPGSDYDKATVIGKRTKEVLVVGVYSEEEFLSMANTIGEESDDE